MNVKPITKPKFGVAIPTGTEGLMYPVPFASAQDNIRIALAAERLGFDSVWGNDHVSTQHYVRGEFDRPPNYYAPMLVLAAIAQATSTLKVATAILVTPFRHPVVIAKEAATLDHLSGGRMILGVGIGAYREEFEAMYGPAARRMQRGEMLDEALSALQVLWAEEDASFLGKYYQFEHVQSYPKPLQRPVPVYIGGNSAEGRKRVARWATGWLPAVLSPDEVRAGVAEIRAHAEAIGRDAGPIDIAPQLAVSLGRTHEEAVAKFRSSQVYKHLQSLKRSTLKGQQSGTYEERNLIGTPDEVREQIARYVDAGVTTFSALLFAEDTVDAFIEAMEWFSEDVMRKL